MAGTVYKQCRHKGCGRSPRCDHPWWLSFSRDGTRYRMSAGEFARKSVASKAEAEEVWLPKFITEIRAGRDPRRPTAILDGTMPVAKFIEDHYTPRHILASGMRYEDSLKSKMRILTKRFGNLPLKALELPGPIEAFRADLVRRGRSKATINRYLAQLRHMINWAVAHGLLERTPFHRYGITLLKGEGKRTRRLHLVVCPKNNFALPNLL